MNHALHFAGFCLAFLISTLLLASTLLTAGCFYKKCLMRAHTYRVRHTHTQICLTLKLVVMSHDQFQHTINHTHTVLICTQSVLEEAEL